MKHVGEHYMHGETLKNARPDTDLHEHLWKKNVLSTVEYRQLHPNAQEHGVYPATASTYSPSKERRQVKSKPRPPV